MKKSDQMMNAIEGWQEQFDQQVSSQTPTRNRSGIEIKPLYTPENDNYEDDHFDKLNMPGEFPYTRGVYASMYRGRTWSQRQLIGLGTPENYNERVKSVLALGGNALSLIPCNSVFRGYDCDEVPEVLLGTCGAVVNTTDHMDACLKDIPIDEISTAMNDPSPFTLFAFLLATAKRRGISWDKITGTANQSDYISHFVANHMFYRLSLSGARRVLLDHIEFCREKVPNWNPVSVVGQHMQQAGATPAETMGFTLATAIQYAEDCIDRGMDPDSFLPRFTFFFDISISLFEEAAKFRAGRRIWARLVRDRLGAKDPRSMRFKFHGQTSGADLTMQQPLNNIARVTTQAIAGILSGLQSMHTDAYDEAIACPSEETAKIAIATQNILREEAHLCDVIDPLGGSYYVEQLTDQMEAKIIEVMDQIEDAGGMYKAVESGLVQKMIGQSASQHQGKIESGEEKLVGVNCYQEPNEQQEPNTYRPNPAELKTHIEAFKKFKLDRNNSAVLKALDNLARVANSENENVFAAIVDAAEVGVTGGEIIACLRKELGFGQPLIAA